MADTQETTADIIAAMRDEGNTGESSCLEWVGAKMRDYADRFEAAHRRERGNCAKLREALRKINSLCGIGVVEISSFEIGSICDDALSSPPRNCDRPECATTKAAQDVWRREDGGKTPYYEWLLAPATEKEGSAK